VPAHGAQKQEGMRVRVIVGHPVSVLSRQLHAIASYELQRRRDGGVAGHAHALAAADYDRVVVSELLHLPDPERGHGVVGVQVPVRRDREPSVAVDQGGASVGAHPDAGVALSLTAGDLRPCSLDYDGLPEIPHDGIRDVDVRRDYRDPLQELLSAGGEGDACLIDLYESASPEHLHRPAEAPFSHLQGCCEALAPDPRAAAQRFEDPVEVGIDCARGRPHIVGRYQSHLMIIGVAYFKGTELDEWCDLYIVAYMVHSQLS